MFLLIRHFITLMFFLSIAHADIQQADLQQMVESTSQPESSEPMPPPSVSNGPMATPHVANTVVLSWANESMVTAFSYDFANYNTSFQLASNYFTPTGWLELDSRHKELQDLQQVIEKKLTMSAVSSGPAKLISQGPVNGVYSWLVEAPYLLIASDATHEMRRNILVRSLIVRSDPDVHYRGLAIDKIAIRYILNTPKDT